jgi:hypothetical protein
MSDLLSGTGPLLLDVKRNLTLFLWDVKRNANVLRLLLR